jgi:nicotinamidase-related amidase
MASLTLITPSDCAVVLVDYQAGLAFAAGSADRQSIRSAALALAKTAVAFSVPVVVSTSATKVTAGR